MSRAPSLALRSLRVRLSRTFLTTLGIVIGVSVIMAIQITNLSTLQSLNNMFSEASGKAQLVILNASSSDEGFSERVRGTVLNIPGVQEAVASIQATAVLADKNALAEQGASFFGSVTNRLILYGIDPAGDVKVRDYKLVAGKFLPPARDVYEVVLVKDYADDQKLKVGDDLGILTPAGLEYLRIIGLISKEGAGQTNNGAFGVIPLAAAQAIFSRAGEVDQVDIVAESSVSSGDALDALRASIQERLGQDYSVIYPATQGRRVVQMLDVYQMGLSFFSVVAIFVGAFLIYNAFTMTVVERTREIGMLRTVGMTQRQVLRQILTEAAILGVIGSAVGVGLGILMSLGLIRVMEYLMAQEVRHVAIPSSGLLLSVAVGLGVTLVAATLPALQASKISPLEALRARGTAQESWYIRKGWPVGLAMLVVSTIGYLIPLPTKIAFFLYDILIGLMYTGVVLVIPGTVGWWERLMRPVMRRLYGSEGRLGSSNIQRARQRTTLTVTALTVGVAMLYSIASMAASFKRDVTTWIDGYVGGDLFIHSTEMLRSDFGQRLEAIEGVAAVTPLRVFEVKAFRPDGAQETIFFSAVDPASYQRVTKFVFSGEMKDPQKVMDQLAAGDTVFVSTVIADKYGLKVGDTLRLLTRRGQRDFKVAAVVVEFNERGYVIQGSWKDMRRYFGLDDVTGFQAKLKPGYDQAQIAEQIDTLYGARRHLSIISNAAIKVMASSITGQAFAMFDVLGYIAMIVAALGVVNTLMMNVLERTREIGMLRGVGMTRWQVAKMILAEAGMLGLMGGVLGIVFGLFQSRLFVMGANMTQGYRLGQVLPIMGVVVGFAIAIIVSHVAALWPARRASSLRIIEAIQFE